MKKILFLGLSLFIFSSCFTKATKEQLNPTYIVELKDIPKTKIYEKTKQWIASTFKSAKAVIEYDNKEEGTLIGNTIIDRTSSITMSGSSTTSWLASMRVDTKDGKMKVTFFNLISRYTETSGIVRTNDWYLVTLKRLKPKIDNLVKSLTIFIKGKDPKSDW